MTGDVTIAHNNSINTTRHNLKRSGDLVIPPTIHIIWKNLPIADAAQSHISEWRRLHPTWDVRVWTKQEIESLLIDVRGSSLACKEDVLSVLQSSDNTGHWADILRYLVLWLYGGVYADADVHPLRSFEPLLPNQAFVGNIEPRSSHIGIQTMDTAVFGAVSGHPLLEFVLCALKPWFEEHRDSPIYIRTGPPFFATQMEQWASVWALEHPGKPLPLTRLPPVSFYPYQWDEKEQANDAFPDSYAVHEWWGTWLGNEPASV